MPDRSPAPVGTHTGRPNDDGRLRLVTTGVGLFRWFAVLLVVVIVAEVAARGLTQRTEAEIRWYDAAAQQRIDLLDERGDAIEVVFAGTSAPWQAFVPSVFTAATGKASLNVGLAGAVPTVTGPWLTNEVMPRSSPDLVVWGLTPLDFAPGYGSLQEDAYQGAVETSEGWLADVDRSMSSVSSLVSSRRLLRSPTDLFGSGETKRSEDLAAAASVTGPDGERTDFEVDVTPQGAAIQRSRLAGFEIDRNDLDAVIDAIDVLQSGGVTVVLVEVPVPDRFLEQLPQPESDVAATRAAMREIGESTASDVILMGDLLGDTNFVDDIHVDAEGAAQITRWLTDILFAPHSDDAMENPTACDNVEVVDSIGFITAVEVCLNADSN